MIAVTFALESESSDFVRLLADAQKAPDQYTITGVLGRRSIAVLHTGVGEIVATARFADFLRHREPRALISAGFAGGLSDSYKPGELIVAENYSSAELFATAKQLLPHAATVRLKTTGAIVESSSSRSELSRAADAVDMETEFIARACAAKQIPVLSLRVISDTPSHPFPAPADVLFDIQTQRTKLARVGAYIATHPTALPRFIQFARQIKVAGATLADAIGSLVNSDAFG